MIGERHWETVTEVDPWSLGKWRKGRKKEPETLKYAAK